MEGKPPNLTNTLKLGRKLQWLFNIIITLSISKLILLFDYEVKQFVSPQWSVCLFTGDQLLADKIQSTVNVMITYSNIHAGTYIIIK